MRLLVLILAAAMAACTSPQSKTDRAVREARSCRATLDIIRGELRARSIPRRFAKRFLAAADGELTRLQQDHSILGQPPEKGYELREQLEKLRVSAEALREMVDGKRAG